MPFSTLGIHLQKFFNFSHRYLTSRAILKLHVWLTYKTEMFSIYQLYLESFPKGIIHYWFMASSAKKKIYDFEKLKTFRGWVPMNFHGTKKLLLLVSHDLWARNWKIVFHGNWNPRAWVRSTLTEMLFDSVAPLVNITSLGSAPINSATCCEREITITFKKKI